MRGHGWRRGTRHVLCATLLGALAWASPAAANTISVDDVQVAEGTGATVDATFTLTRSAGLFSGGATVSYQTVDGSATSPTDYVATGGTATFDPALLGAIERQRVTVPVQGDALDEANETFRLDISGSAEIVPGGGTATIADDDPTPTLSVTDSAPVAEGAGAHASFVVRLSAASGRDVSVGYATANGSATAGSDYVASSGTLVLAAGSTQAGVDVGLLDDGVAEPTETFELRLGSAVAATIGDGVGTGTILDNDAPGSGAPAPGPTAPATGAIPQQTKPTIPLPVIGSTGPTTGSSSTHPSLGVASPRLKRPSTVLVTLSCPKVAGTCSGRITLFSVPNKRSKIKALRKERKLGRITFTMQGGRAQTLSLALRRSDRRLLQRTGRLRVRAYALTQDAAGRTGVRSVNGTLIARTAHSSPSR